MLWMILWSSLAVLLAWLLWDEEQAVDRLPGLPRWPICGSAFKILNLDTKQMFVLLRQIATGYGDRSVVKVFKMRMLHVHSPGDVELVLTHSKNITKGKSYTFLEPWLGTGLLISTGSKWHKRRKILSPAFHFNILKNFTTIMEEKSRELVTQMKRKQGGRVEVLPLISDFTLATICETAMGTQLDSDKSAKTVTYKNAIQDIGQLLMHRIATFYLHVDAIFKASALGKRFQQRLETVHSFADDVILEKKKQRAQNPTQVLEALTSDFSKRRLAMLDLLLEEESRGNIDLEGIREEVNTFMFEGHDTTAMALTFALMLLADHEEVQARVFEECQQIFGESARTPNMADMSEMKYLEAVIKETLRLYPSVPFIGRTITEDFVLGELEVKSGIEVGVHIYDLHRRAELFPEPDAFQPERFLTQETRHPYAYVPFSAGPRNCIGQRFAMLEMKCVLAEISRAFKLRPAESGARPALIADMVLRPASPVYVHFIPRK